MSLFEAFKNLSPRTRLGVGAGLFAWGIAGLYLTDTAEKKLGLEATEADREALRAMTPRIHVVDSGGGEGGAKKE